VLAVVAMANTDGGMIYLGVEDSGQVTGLLPRHRDANGLAALVANRTVPPISVRVTLLEEEGHTIAAIEVPKSPRPVASSEGTLQRRRLGVDGRPAAVPFLPHEFATRASTLGLLDYSALPVDGAGEDAIDPLERERLRQLIQRYQGDSALAGLADHELDGALGLSRQVDGRHVPSVAGLLLIGRESALRQHLPTHEVAFQVLDGTDVLVNEFFRTPLLRTFERILDLLDARIVEEEVQDGLFRVAIPNVDRRALREALVNALTHRDYTRLGAVHVRWETDVLSISNPGGFVEGVTADNLLVVEPRPRNPLLADAFKRVGLAERTGRGVDLIFKGLLRYGRPGPDYGRSDATTVVVRLSRAEADLPFVRLVLDVEKKAKTPIPLDALIVLARVRDEKRIDIAQVARAIQKDESAARAVVERLVELGLLEAHGVKRGRTYTLSATVYRELGQGPEYIRQAGFDQIQQEQMVHKWVAKHGQIRRREVIDLCKMSPKQATRMLRKLVDAGILKMVGERKAATYGRGPNF